MTQALSQAVQNAAEANTETETFRLMQNAATRYRFRYFSIIDTRQAFTERKDASIITNWGEEMMRAYDELGIISKSKVYDCFSETNTPLEWTIHDHCDGHELGAQQKIMAFGEDFSVRAGLCVPVFDSDGTKYRFCYSGDRDRLSATEISEVFLISTTAFQTFTELRDTTSADSFGPGLTPRECECLKWTAAGKTSEEIAIILGLSKHTVNHYLSQSVQKLDCVNRVHAVAKALRNDWLT